MDRLAGTVRVQDMATATALVALEQLAEAEAARDLVLADVGH